MPSRSAVSFAGGAASLRPRPRGASGRVSSQAISWRAASRSRTSAPERSRRGDGDGARLSARTGCGRNVASASLRCSSSVRSMISTPSRWSSSCWTMRAQPFELEAHVVAARVPSLERHLGRALDRDAYALQRQAALRRRSPRRARSTARIDDRARAVVVRLEHEQAAEDADLRRGEPDALRLVHQDDHPLDEPAGRSSSNSVTSRAFMRSATSGYWRICASA